MFLVAWLRDGSLAPSARLQIPVYGDFSHFVKSAVFRGFSISAKNSENHQKPFWAWGVLKKAVSPLFTKHPGPEGDFGKLFPVRRVEGFLTDTFGSDPAGVLKFVKTY